MLWVLIRSTSPRGGTSNEYPQVFMESLRKLSHNYQPLRGLSLPSKRVVR